MPNKLSVVIATHNRAHLLHTCLESLVKQSLDDELYEIIVVGNRCSDKTEELVNAMSKKHKHIVYVQEQVVGLSHARNRGVRESKGTYIAFIDDDAIADMHWLEEILNAFNTAISKPGCVGGPIIPLWTSPRPTWFTDNFLPFVSALDLGKESHFLEENEHVYGTNMAFDREALLSVGLFDATLGRKRGRLLSNEEVHVQQKLLRAGDKTYYASNVTVQHKVQGDRLSKWWLLKRHFWQGVSDIYLQNALEVKRPLGTASWLRFEWNNKRPMFHRLCSGAWHAGANMARMNIV